MSLSHCPNCGCRLGAFEPVQYGNVRIGSAPEIVFRGMAVALARTQFGIVEALIRARGRYLSRGQLVGVLGGEIYDQAICQYVKRARSAFLAVDPGFDQIECLRGFSAYRWRYRPDDSSVCESLGTLRSKPYDAADTLGLGA